MAGLSIATGVVATDPSSGGTFTDATLTNPTITGGSINGTHIGNIMPSDGAFTTLNATSANILGVLGAEGVNSTANSQPAGTANSGITLGAATTWAAITYFDQSLAADARTADAVWLSGAYSLRFKNDAGNSASVWLQGVGAYNAITAINSNSGSGAWTHTGALNATTVASSGFNTVTLTGATTGNSPTITTAGGNVDVGLTITTKGAGGLVLQAATSSTGQISTSVAGKGFATKEGTNAKQGTATMVAGTVTVSNTSVTASSRIFLTAQSLGTVTAPKALAVTARTASTSFVITSADNTDTSVVAYEIFEPG